MVVSYSRFGALTRTGISTACVRCLIRRGPLRQHRCGAATSRGMLVCNTLPSVDELGSRNSRCCSTAFGMSRDWTASCIRENSRAAPPVRPPCARRHPWGSSASANRRRVGPAHGRLAAPYPGLRSDIRTGARRRGRRTGLAGGPPRQADLSRCTAVTRDTFHLINEKPWPWSKGCF